MRYVCKERHTKLKANNLCWWMSIYYFSIPFILRNIICATLNNFLQNKSEVVEMIKISSHLIDDQIDDQLYFEFMTYEWSPLVYWHCCTVLFFQNVQKYIRKLLEKHELNLEGFAT